MYATEKGPVISKQLGEAASAVAKLAGEKGPVAVQRMGEGVFTAARFAAKKGPLAVGYLVQIVKAHPMATATVVVLIVAILAPRIFIGILNILGFAVGGVVKGSIATGIQSVVYGAWTRGVFSVLQSIGATGVAPPAVPTIGSIAIMSCFARLWLNGRTSTA
ncbi:hypothetical protein CC1G_12067 [Coprinopsis cinerea okayama7|uniref:Uncharacterized protein n=1 Tax=Coprinopsis cinerea (strain Okayama-7 / 130 / ATCC MYA-4618 / FGSC 9003) TaxID=240176 RepID=A8N0D6_COPC7|nr:hypothetical protein CC1G_12067 [Coprinopsis cinerea okayama7\|eukprot:XP_001828337.1 hypothetical protein CC1G_12067 [Coprinopsis cinerea okayama7\